MEEPSQDVKILLIEDDPGFGLLIQRRLSLAGYQVAVVKTGAEALQRLRDPAGHFDLVLIDYMLPDTNANELVGQEWEALGSPPFMVMTGFGDERVAVEMMKLGAEDYIVKDSDLLHSLVPTMQRILRHVESRRQLVLAEKRLKESEERYSLALNATRISVWDIELPAGRVYLDRRWSEISGMDSPQQPAQLDELLKCIHAEDIGEYLENWREFVGDATSSQTFSATFRLNRDDKKTCWIEQNATVVEEHVEGSAIRIISTMHDVTARVQLHAMEQKLLQAQRLDVLGTLAGGIAHDFNNVLAAIMGFNELMQRDKANVEIVDKATTHIQQAAHRARDIVRQVLLYSRQEEPEVCRVDLVGIINESIGFIRAIAPVNVQLSFDHNIDEAWVNADASQISQVITNLLSNAIHAVKDRDGCICVTLAQIADVDRTLLYDVEVLDNGNGVPPEIEQRIFDPFFSTKDRGQGAGLGLATSKGIIETHGGRIFLNNVPGRGACFHLQLPKAKEKEDTPTPALQDTTSAAGTSVLVVDDEAALADVTTDLLKLNGLEAQAFHDPVMALEHCRDTGQRFDVAILDYSMPRLNGLQLLEQLHELDPDLRCILVTGNFEEIRSQAKDLTKFELLHKPYSHDELMGAINGGAAVIG